MESNTNKTNQTTVLDEQTEFISIDDPNLNWPPFVLSMLKVGRILTKKEAERFEITAAQVSRCMQSHINEIKNVYRGREIRMLFGYYGGYLVGGGIKIEAQEYYPNNSTVKHYHFSFTRLYRPEELIAPKSDDNERGTPESEIEII